MFILNLLNDEGRQLELADALFKSGYNRGIESFEGIMDELSNKGWIIKNMTPTGHVPGMPHLRTNKVTYEISLEGIDYLVSIGQLEDKFPNKEDQSQSASSQNITTKAAAPAIATITKISIGVVTTVLGGLIIWYLTTQLL